MNKRKVIITVDVEALSGRANQQHIDRLIWGRFPGQNEDYGLLKIMDIADEYKVPLTCFVDFASYNRLGEGILDVGREIDRHGHDVQVHMHLEDLGREFWLSRALHPQNNDNITNPHPYLAEKAVDFTIDAYSKAIATPPMAFRNCAYALYGYLLDRLAHHGVPIDSTWNKAYLAHSFFDAPVHPFRWDNGLLEMPISCVPNKQGREMAYNFNASFLMKGEVADCLARNEKYLNDYFSCFGENSVAVMVMHSWSFLNKNEKGHFSLPNEAAIEKYHALMQYFSQNMQVLTMRDLAGQQDILGNLPTVDRSQAKIQAVNFANITVPESPYACSWCGTSADTFHTMSGEPLRKCPKCLSLERQRVFWRMILNGEFDRALADKKILHLSPSSVERKMLAQLSSQVTSLDIRPTVKSDVVGDFCAMPFPDEHFDAVFSCFALTCTENFTKAIEEVHRVLKPGGVWLSHEPLAENADTLSYKEDFQLVTSFYGKEAYQQYKIGTFRSFGENDYLSFFQGGFQTALHSLLDHPTGLKIHWLKANKKAKPTICEVARGTSVKERSKKTFYIHVGMAKTGTSSIVHFMLSKRELLLNRHNLYLPTAGSAEPVGGRQRVSLRVRIADMLSTSPEWLDTLIEELQQNQQYNFLVSDTSSVWVHFKKELFTRLQNALPEHQFKIIVYVRRMDEYVKGRYVQSLKTPIPHWPVGDYQQCVNSLEKGFNDSPSQVYISKLLKEYQDLVSPENVIIQIYDKSRFVEKNLITSFFELLGISFANDVDTAIHVNKSSLLPEIVPLLTRDIRPKGMMAEEHVRLTKIAEKVSGVEHNIPDEWALLERMRKEFDRVDEMVPGFSKLLENGPLSLQYPGASVDPSKLFTISLLYNLMHDNYVMGKQLEKIAIQLESTLSTLNSIQKQREEQLGAGNNDTADSVTKNSKRNDA